MPCTNSPNVQAFDALVALVAALRPGWQAPGIKAGIRNALAADQPFTFADLAKHATERAMDANAETPAVIAHLGATSARRDEARIHGWSEGDPRTICAECAMTEVECRRRSATNGHTFHSRHEAYSNTSGEVDLRASVRAVVADLAINADSAEPDADDEPEDGAA